jgi:hypothetical protein
MHEYTTVGVARVILGWRLELPSGCEVFQASPVADAIFWHPAVGVESGRISAEEFGRVVAGAKADWEVVRWLRRTIQERGQLSSLQLLSYAQLTGPHVQ